LDDKLRKKLDITHELQNTIDDLQINNKKLVEELCIEVTITDELQRDYDKLEKQFKLELHRNDRLENQIKLELYKNYRLQTSNDKLIEHVKLKQYIIYILLIIFAITQSFFTN
jgi:hypothetical protein